MNPKFWRVTYVVGNTYKRKYVWAADESQAIKRARVKNIVELEIVDTKEGVFLHGGCDC